MGMGLTIGKFLETVLKMQEGKQYKTFYIRKKNNTMSMGSFFILIPKNSNAKECSSYHTIVFISHALVARLCSKSFKLGFNNTWTKNFQMYKLGFEEAEETEIRLPSFVGSWRKQECSRKNIYFCFTDCAKAFDCVDHNKLWKIPKETRVPDYLTCLLQSVYAGHEAN